MSGKSEIALAVTMWLGVAIIICWDSNKERKKEKATAETGDNQSGNRLPRAALLARFPYIEHPPECPESAKQWRQAERQAEYTKWVAWVAVVALVTSVIGAGVAGCAFLQSQRQFREDERPYLIADIISATPDGPGILFPMGRKAEVDVMFINYGKTIAVKGAQEVKIWFGPKASTDMDSFFSSLPTKVVGGSSVTPPNAMAKRGDNGFAYTSIFSSNIITNDDASFLKSRDGGAVVAGRVWYFDVFGQSHYTDFCRTTLLTGAVAECNRHNEIH